jgi:hypothetical protein
MNPVVIVGDVLLAGDGRGATARPRMRELLAAAARRVPPVGDPHPRGAEPVLRARLVRPGPTVSTRRREARGDVGGGGGDHTADQLPEASVVAGGRTIVVPYLPGRSTTRILAHRT